MKLVIQKVSNASVEVEENCVGKINQGFLVLVGIGKEDTKEIAVFLHLNRCIADFLNH